MEKSPPGNSRAMYVGFVTWVSEKQAGLWPRSPGHSGVVYAGCLTQVPRWQWCGLCWVSNSSPQVAVVWFIGCLTQVLRSQQCGLCWVSDSGPQVATVWFMLGQWLPKLALTANLAQPRVREGGLNWEITQIIMASLVCLWGIFFSVRWWWRAQSTLGTPFHGNM